MRQTTLPNLGTSIQPAKKRKRSAAIEEINFDPAARQDYLTGFHKRKQQRLKDGQQKALKRAKEDRVRRRRQMREDRDATIKANAEASNSLIAAAQGIKPSLDALDDEHCSDDGGNRDVPFTQYDKDYIDENLHASVTVQEVEPTKAGLLALADVRKAVEEDQPPPVVEPSTPSGHEISKVSKLRSKPSRSDGSARKKNKKPSKVRYLNIEERKLAKTKERRSHGASKSKTKKKK